MPNIKSRMFVEEDKEELNDLYNRSFGRSRTIEQFEWEWLNTPEGWGSIWILEDSDTGKIVGHHGLMPFKFSYMGRTILVGKTENNVIDSQYRGKGIYSTFAAKCLEEAKERFDLVFTTAGSGAKRRVRQGYAVVAGYTLYIKATKKSCLDKLVASIMNERTRNKFITALLVGACKLSDIILMLFFSRKGPTDKAIKLERVTNIDAVAEELDKFWERNKGKFGITIDRNSRYLKWRIFDNPNLSYEFFLAVRQRQVVGYVITKSSEGIGVKLGTIVDLIANDNNEVIFNSILNRAEGIFRENGIYIIHFPTLLSDNSLNKALKRNGFVSFLMFRKLVRRALGKGQQESLFMARALDDKLNPAKVSDPACWYFTNLFMEGRA